MEQENDSQQEIRGILHEGLAKAKNKNPSYSLRAFARRLGVYSSTLSEIMNGKREVTGPMAYRLLGGLNLEPEVINQYILKIEEQKRLRAIEGAGRIVKSSKPAPNYHQLAADEFKMVSDWQYFAILSVTETENFDGTEKQIADRLGLSDVLVKQAVQRLLRLDLLKLENDRIVPTGKQFTTTTDIPNESLKQHHYQNLELARRSLDYDDLYERDFSFIYMAIDPANISQIKTRIKNFRRQLVSEFESKSKKEVYKMCIQLFPMSNRKKVSV